MFFLLPQETLWHNLTQICEGITIKSDILKHLFPTCKWILISLDAAQVAQTESNKDDKLFVPETHSAFEKNLSIEFIPVFWLLCLWLCKGVP